MGRGVGGLQYSQRGSATKYNLSNRRGDVVAQSDGTGALTWTASYEAFGKRTKETGTIADIAIRGDEAFGGLERDRQGKKDTEAGFHGWNARGRQAQMIGLGG